VSVSSTIKTTGTKLVGEKAKGEVAIFNKLDSPQTIPKGSVLLDSSGRKFETQNQVSVASSSSNLEEGVITLGQTKTIVQAQDIGPEYNIAKDTKLTLKDHPETSLVAKSQQAFVGGTKEQISAVGQEDVKLVQEKIKQSIESAIDQKIEENINNLAGAIKETLKIKQQKIEYSREIGEQADELTASVDAEISVLVLDQSLYPTIAEAFLASDESFQKSTKDSSSLSFAFSDINAGSDKTTAKLTISGLLTPLLDENKIKQDLKGKNLKYTHEYLQKNVPRVYNFTTQTNFPFLEFVNPFPFKVDRIEVETKIESP